MFTSKVITRNSRGDDITNWLMRKESGDSCKANDPFVWGVIMSRIQYVVIVCVCVSLLCVFVGLFWVECE